MTKDEFLKGVSNWDNHRHCLWLALEKTNGEVVEMGCGDGSTPFLRVYCHDAKRELFSYESNEDWYRRMMDYNGEGHHVFHVKDWGEVSEKHIHPSVVLIDHAPGERRQIDVKLFANKSSIVVMHDTEPAADHGYKMRQHIPLFKWWVDYKTDGAWASMGSNFVDLSEIRF